MKKHWKKDYDSDDDDGFENGDVIIEERKEDVEHDN